MPPRMKMTHMNAHSNYLRNYTMTSLYAYTTYRTNDEMEPTIVISSVPIDSPFAYDAEYVSSDVHFVEYGIEAIDQMAAKMEEDGMRVHIDASAVKAGNIYKMIGLAIKLVVGAAAGMGVIALVSNLMVS